VERHLRGLGPLLHDPHFDAHQRLAGSKINWPGRIHDVTITKGLSQIPLTCWHEILSNV